MQNHTFSQTHQSTEVAAGCLLGPSRGWERVSGRGEGADPSSSPAPTRQRPWRRVPPAVTVSVPPRWSPFLFPVLQQYLLNLFPKLTSVSSDLCGFCFPTWPSTDRAHKLSSISFGDRDKCGGVPTCPDKPAASEPGPPVPTHLLPTSPHLWSGAKSYL